jgi:leader peptidase (prepilin peptidase)/N-methyltransferase
MIVLIGFVVGVPSVIVAVFIGTLTAAAFSVVLIVTRKRTRRDYIPHGPFLALGAVVALFWGADIWDAYQG